MVNYTGNPWKRTCDVFDQFEKRPLLLFLHASPLLLSVVQSEHGQDSWKFIISRQSLLRKSINQVWSTKASHLMLKRVFELIEKLHSFRCLENITPDDNDDGQNGVLIEELHGVSDSVCKSIHSLHRQFENKNVEKFPSYF